MQTNWIQTYLMHAFKIAYDLVESTFIECTRKYRQINQTLSDTTSKLKFMKEIVKRIQIKTGVRRGDGFSPLLFNIIQDEDVRDWEK